MLTSRYTHPPHRARRQARVGRRALAALGLVLALAMPLAACGSSKKKAHAPAPQVLTKADYVAKANAICAAADPALVAAMAKLAARPTRAQVIALVRSTFVPSTEAQIRAIRALRIPPGEEAIAHRMLALVQADLAKLKRNPALIKGDVFGDFARVAHPYGLAACAPTS
jgi:hypothetical protein